MNVRAVCLAILVGAVGLAEAGPAPAQTTPEAGADLNAVPVHADATARTAPPSRRRARRTRPAPPPSSTAADIAAIRKGEAIVHGATTATQSPTTNTGYTGGPELKGDILKSGPTGPQ